MTSRVKFIRHKGVNILHIDWSKAGSEELLQTLEEAQRVIASQPTGSVRTLTTVHEARVDKAVTTRLKDYVAHNKPFVRAGAVVGLNDLKMIIFNFVNRATGRNLRAMDNVDAAKEWLASA